MPDLWVPWAEKREVALRDSQKVLITPVGLVCHTAVSNAIVLTPTGTTRWHFYLGKTGKLYQFFPLNRPAACQLHGNYWTRDGKGFGFLSCESWDGAGTSVWPDYRTNHSGGPAWTAEQMGTWGRLGGWLHDEWGIYLGKATAPRGKGIGQHSDFTGKDPDIRWNTSHACVGTKRKAQMNEVRARMVAAITPPPRPTPEDDMPTPEAFAKAFADLDSEPYGGVAGVSLGRYIVGSRIALDAEKERDKEELARAVAEDLADDLIVEKVVNGFRGELGEIKNLLNQAITKGEPS